MRLRAGTVSDTPTYPHDWGARKPRHFATLFSKRGADNVLTTPRSRWCYQKPEYVCYKKPLNFLWRLVRHALQLPRQRRIAGFLLPAPGHFFI